METQKPRKLKNNRKNFFLPAVFVFLAVIAVFLYWLHGRNQFITSGHNSIEMGTVVSLTLYGKKGLKSESAVKNQLNTEAVLIFDIIRDLDDYVLSWRSDTSEVFRFNQSRSTEPFPSSPDLAEVVHDSLELGRLTGGALDITMRPLIEMWGIEEYEPDTPYFPPEEAELLTVSEKIGVHHLTCDENHILKDNPDIQLDLGAVGKGYALDLAVREILQRGSISGAVLSVGGSVLAYGDKGEPYQIAVRDPQRSPSDYLGILTIPGETGQSVFISTSGGYEKFAEADGIVYEHIIDGRTLHPTDTGLYSATIVTYDSGLASDGLSTACYILGPENSVELLQKVHGEAVFVYRDGSVVITPGLENSFSLTAPGYHITGLLTGNFSHDE